MSANFASPSNQIDWLTTHSTFGDWYILTQRLDSLWVPNCEAPNL